MRALQTGGAFIALQIAAWAGPVHAAPAINDDVIKCAAMSADAARLACYDLVAARMRAQRTPTGDGLSSSAVQAPGPPSGPSPIAPGRGAAANDTASFGLNKPVVAERGPAAVTSRVKKITEDLNRNTYVLLDNGQTWTFNDADSLLRVDDSVVIKKAALGSFVMSTPTKRTFRVRRIS